MLLISIVKTSKASLYFKDSLKTLQSSTPRTDRLDIGQLRETKYTIFTFHRCLPSSQTLLPLAVK